MFKQDQPTIARYAAQGPDETARVIKFALLTVQRHLEQVAPLMDEENLKVTSTTRRGIEYAEAHKRELHAMLQDHHVNDEDCMVRLVQVPGLGIVKAGFVMQLIRGTVGCLDIHNMKLYGLEPKAFRSTPSIKALTERVRLYIMTCKSCGGPEALWDNWCHHVANLRPQVWQTADHVSFAHVHAIF